LSKFERAYNLVEERKIVSKRKPDPIEEEIRAEEEELAREARRLRLQELVAKRKKRVKELEGGINPGVGGLDISPAMAMELAKLPEEERNRVIQTYAALKSAEKLGGAGALLMPLLVGYAKANPGSSQNSMVEFARAMTDQLKTGIELARQTQPQQTNPIELAKTITDQVKTGISLAKNQQPQVDAVKLVEIFKDLVKENVQRPIEEVVKRIQPQPSVLERILMDDKLFDRLKNLGLFGGGQPQQTSADIQLEIEKLKTDREMKLKELDMKLEEMRQQHSQWLMQQQMQAQAEERRWKVVEGLMQGPLGRVVQTVGTAAAAKISGATPPKPIPIECPQCGHHFYGSSDAKIVVCPKCNTPLTPAPEAPKSGQESQVQEPKQEATSTPS